MGDHTHTKECFDFNYYIEHNKDLCRKFQLDQGRIWNHWLKFARFDKREHRFSCKYVKDIDITGGFSIGSNGIDIGAGISIANQNVTPKPQSESENMNESGLRQLSGLDQFGSGNLKPLLDQLRNTSGTQSGNIIKQIISQIADGVKTSPNSDSKVVKIRWGMPQNESHKSKKTKNQLNVNLSEVLPQQMRNHKVGSSRSIGMGSENGFVDVDLSLTEALMLLQTLVYNMQSANPVSPFGELLQSMLSSIDLTSSIQDNVINLTQTVSKQSLFLNLRLLLIDYNQSLNTGISSSDDLFTLKQILTDVSYIHENLTLNPSELSGSHLSAYILDHINFLKKVSAGINHLLVGLQLHPQLQQNVIGGGSPFKIPCLPTDLNQLIVSIQSAIDNNVTILTHLSEILPQLVNVWGNLIKFEISLDSESIDTTSLSASVTTLSELLQSSLITAYPFEKLDCQTKLQSIHDSLDVIQSSSEIDRNSLETIQKSLTTLIKKITLNQFVYDVSNVNIYSSIQNISLTIGYITDALDIISNPEKGTIADLINQLVLLIVETTEDVQKVVIKLGHQQSSLPNLADASTLIQFASPTMLQIFQFMKDAPPSTFLGKLLSILTILHCVSSLNIGQEIDNVTEILISQALQLSVVNAPATLMYRNQKNILAGTLSSLVSRISQVRILILQLQQQQQNS